MSRKEYYRELKLKRLLKFFSFTLVISVVLFLTLFVMYSKKMKEESANNLQSLSMIESIVSNEDLEETNFSDNLSVEDKKEENVSKPNYNKNVRNVVDKTPVEATVKNTESEKKEPVKEDKKELKFMAPVAGEILKDFATDTLIYSNTLEEWTTHPGIDIKAEKTSIVVSAEAGKVESIKNDPRYGLTVIVAHNDGFKTVYSNLLTTEFVKENEVIEKGQTIGTIGETGSFEVADDAHLHFEMYKDGNLVNPTIYLK